jgi:hypothetical protein
MQRETLLRRTGTVPNTGALYGPGSAAQREERRAASGERRSISVGFAREQLVAYY